MNHLLFIEEKAFDIIAAKYNKIKTGIKYHPNLLLISL
jgi:hypothetical protein